MTATPSSSSSSSVITLTFGECAENHRGMQRIGSCADEGFSYADLIAIRRHFAEGGAIGHEEVGREEKESLKEKPEGGSESGGNDSSESSRVGLGGRGDRQSRFAETVMVAMRPPGRRDAPAAAIPSAHVLVVRGGVDALGVSATALFDEQRALRYDTKARMYGRVLNKHARWNLCFDAVAQEPDYEAGKGRIVAMRDVPLLQELHAAVEGLLPPKTAGMKVESNYYYDAAKCGIGFHGDTERKRVVGARLGTAAMPIYFRWFHNGRAVGEKVEIPLYPGDLYVMSEKAAGSDWRSSSKYTLRHAVGKNFAK